MINGIRVNVEYIENESILAQVIKGNSSYNKHDIVRFTFDEIDNSFKGEIVEFKKNSIK